MDNDERDREVRQLFKIGDLSCISPAHFFINFIIVSLANQDYVDDQIRNSVNDAVFPGIDTKIT